MGDYRFQTYRETFERIDAIGRGLLSIGLKKGDRILIFAETRAEWLLTALAAFRHGLTVVTLYATLGEEAVKHGINESEVPLIVTSHDLLTKLEVTTKRLIDQILLFRSKFLQIENFGSNTKSSLCHLFSSIGQESKHESAEKYRSH